MDDFTISDIKARQVLDSRGNPTVEAEVFLENALKTITEIDILESGGIIIAERPLGKDMPWEFSGFSRSRDYKYGKTLLTVYRKD